MKLLICLFILSCSIAHARSVLNVGKYRGGIQIGSNTLLQDVGGRYGSSPSVFVGGQFGHAITKSLLMTAGFQRASHGQLTQTLYPFGISEFLETEDWPITPHFDLGLVYISNTLADFGQTSAGFGLTLGAGAEKYISEEWLVDLTFRYLIGFEQSIQTRELGNIKSLQDNIQLMLSLHYEFGDDLTK